MQLHSVLSSAVTYNALISTCEKGIQAGRSRVIFKAMQRQSVVPNVIT